jgi:signal transduction histidine kinase
LRLHELKARYSAVLDERNRIAREIHDTLAQNLAGIALQLDSVTMQATGIPPELRRHLDQACNLTRYSLAEARGAVLDLRSQELERQELTALLPKMAESIRENAASKTLINVKIRGVPRPLSPVAVKNLLRIFQEAVANAIKHANATRVEAELEFDGDRLTLRVRDDGCGFDADQTIPLYMDHYGLIGMRERAIRIGGRLTLNSRPGEGTEIVVQVPLPA